MPKTPLTTEPALLELSAQTAPRPKLKSFAALTALLALGLTACGDGDSDNGNGDDEAETNGDAEGTDETDDDAEAGEGDGIPADQTEFTLGVASENEGHRLLVEIAEEELGYEIDLVNFSDYHQANPALTNGDLDFNWFQHIAFLAEHNVASGDDLQPIGSTAAVPLTLYSEQYEDISEFQEGDTVAIPNDAVNQGRAINVLVEADLVVLAEETPQPEPRHIDEDASTVEVQPVDAAQTVNALQSVDGSVINNNFAQDAELNPTEDGIFADDPNDPSAFPYINAFVARAEDQDHEALREIAALYHDERVLEQFDEQSAGTSVPASEVTAEELQEALVDYEDALRELE